MKVIKIGAEWCNGCIVMRPRWQKIERENPWLETEYYDYDADKEIVERYGLEEGTLPTFIFLDKNDAELTRIHGEIPEKEIIQIIEENKEK